MGEKCQSESVSMLSFSAVGGKTTEEEQSSPQSDILQISRCQSKSLLDWVIFKKKTWKIRSVPFKEVYVSNMLLKHNVLLRVELCPPPTKIRESFNPQYLRMGSYWETESLEKQSS